MGYNPFSKKKTTAIIHYAIERANQIEEEEEANLTTTTKVINLPQQWISNILLGYK